MADFVALAGAEADARAETGGSPIDSSISRPPSPPAPDGEGDVKPVDGTEDGGDVAGDDTEGASKKKEKKKKKKKEEGTAGTLTLSQLKSVSVVHV